VSLDELLCKKEGKGEFVVTSAVYAAGDRAWKLQIGVDWLNRNRVGERPSMRGGCGGFCGWLFRAGNCSWGGFLTVRFLS
jgi:hypothetical protein